MSQVHHGKYGFYPCNYEEFRLIQRLWREVLGRRQIAANWWRWARKSAKNRVRRQTHPVKPIPIPIPEPMAKQALVGFRPGTVLPDGSYSGYTLTGPDVYRDPSPWKPQKDSPLCRLQRAYYQARHPKETAEKVEALAVTMMEVRRWMVEIGMTVDQPQVA